MFLQMLLIIGFIGVIIWNMINLKKLNKNSKIYDAHKSSIIISIVGIILALWIGRIMFWAILIAVVAIYLIISGLDGAENEDEFLKVLPDGAKIYERINWPSAAQQSFLARNNEIHFMVKMNDDSIEFPEVNNIKYALTNVEFNPEFIAHTQTKGHTGRAIAGGLIAGAPGAIIGASGKRKSKTTQQETKSPILLTFVNLENKEQHIIQIKGMTSDANKYKTKYLYPREII